MNAVERIKEECKTRGIPVSKLERDCGFANGYISGLKRGIMPYDRLEKVAEYFGISSNYLMTGEKPGSDFKGMIDAMVGGLDYFIPANDTVNLIVETINKWKPDQQKRLLKQIEQINAIIGENP